MKWLRRILAIIALLVLALVAALALTAMDTERPVGFQVGQTSVPGGQPFAIGIWYPTSARPRPTTFLGGLVLNVAPDGAVAGKDLPLVLISHGNGGGPGSHADLAMALANAGYVVAAPMHPGDNYADPSASGSATLFSDRNRQLKATLDHLLGKWSGRASLDPGRIGAFGMSAGGFTVLTSVGARPDLGLIASHCAQSPEFICEVLAHFKSPLLNADAAALGGEFVADPRIKAAAVAAPGLGFTFVPDGLAGVTVPVQLWSGELDSKVPFASNAQPVRDALGPRVEFHPVPGAEHTSFLAPCGLLAPPALCADPGDFDRKAFHTQMNARVIVFFDQALD